MSLNDGQDLPFGKYSLLVCGSTEPSSLSDLLGASLDGDKDGLAGGDFVLDFTIGDTEEFCFPLRPQSNRLAMICL